ncbi:MAG: DUF4349 domain-containing protein [Solirubrobacteraceae bacterium]
MTESDEITTALAVIDATLSGEAVGPEHAELAELSLLLADGREAPEASFAASLDQRAARRFGPEPIPGERSPRQRARWRWMFAPAATVGLAAIVALIFVLGSGSGPRPLVQLYKGLSSGPAVRGAAASTSTASASAASPSGSASAPAAGASLGTKSGNGVIASPAPTPSTSGRQIVQSAQLSLSTPPSRVDSVAQQVFDVVAAQHGVVQNSNVTATTSYGNAQFALSVPSANLSATLNALSQLRGASVVSRSDATQDITGQVGSAGRQLAEARALRTALLRQLAAASTAAAVSSLKSQIRDVDAAIARNLSTLQSLHHQVAYSQIQVVINSVGIPGLPISGSGGFTLHRALHDAGRVLVVAAGVALIALAVLVPVALLVGIGLWLAAALRRRRREQVLDLI